MSRVWLGADLGTQGCRVVAADEAGGLITEAECALRSAYRGDGRHEQDPRAWQAAIASACREVIAEIGARQVAGIAVCSTSGTMLVCDQRGRPLTPALMYSDSRAHAELPIVSAAWQECAPRNGYQVQATWALAKLLWAMHNVDGAQRGRMYHSADYVAAWLVGAPVATDWSHALKTGYDLVGQQWPQEAFEAAGIPPSVLPHVVRPGTVLGSVGADGAAATGLAAGTPVLAGLTDGCAAQIASGTVHHGQWNCSLGTTFVLKGVWPDLLTDGNGALYSHAHPDGGWLPGGASNSGAGMLAARFPDASPAGIDSAAQQVVPIDAVTYPLPRRGERFPFVRPDAEAFQLGSVSSDGQAYAAVLQGMAFVERLSLAYVEQLGARVTGSVALTGATAGSAFLTQLRADVLGRAVRLPKYPSSAFGAAVVAAAGSGSVTEATDRMVTTADVVEPRKELTDRYIETYSWLIGELQRRGYIEPALGKQAVTS